MKNLTLFKTQNSIHLKQISKKSEIIKQEDCDGYLVDTSGDEKEARSIIESLKQKNKIVALMGGNNVFNRRALETLKINYLVSPEKDKKQDTLKQRDSGINHVTAKIAKEKNIGLVINFSELKKLQSKQLSIRLERIIQNIKISRRTSSPIKVATFAKNETELVDNKILQEFMISLGASTKQAKEAIIFN